MTQIKAVIFDMDGVLIDSEIVYLEHQCRQLKEKYPWITPESLYPVVGMSGQEYPSFMAQLCRRADDAQFRQELDELNAACKVYYPDILRPQVRGVLQTLKEMGMQIALASSSSAENIAQVLEECELTHYFTSIVSGGQFTHSKPDPEIYLYTMQKLGRKPEECLIVEDSTYGVQAGAASGGIVAALRDERFPFDQSRACFRIEDLGQIPALAACGGRQIRAAFFDIDGTLITSGSHRLPEGLPEALEQLRQNGVAILLSTGRHPLEVEEENLLPGLVFDGAVYMNGQLCEWKGKPVLENAIPAEDLTALHAFLKQTGRSCIFLEKDRMYANLVDDRMRVEQANIGTAVPPVRPIDGLEQRRIDQVIPFITPEEERILLEQMPHCQTKRWGENVVDLMSKNGGKENGIRALCAAMGIEPEQAIAFGDAENDREMLQLAGIGVAMGNALPQVKACADYVTDAVEDNGIVYALQHFGLIGV